MAVGKNKGLSKSGKRGVKKKIMDPFTRKDWYDVKAPSIFTNRHIGKTLVNRTQGTRIASDGLKGRVFEMSLSDLQADTDDARSFRTFRHIAEDVEGRNILTNFYGMEVTTDKFRSMVKKWQTTIDSYADVKTSDGYLLRIFCVGFTQKNQISQKKHSYAKHSQIKRIRKIMVDIIGQSIQGVSLKEVVNMLMLDSITKVIEKHCQGIYPLHDVYFRKVKVLKKPRFDLAKLLDMHGEGKVLESGDAGAPVDQADCYEPPVQDSV